LHNVVKNIEYVWQNCLSIKWTLYLDYLVVWQKCLSIKWTLCLDYLVGNLKLCALIVRDHTLTSQWIGQVNNIQYWFTKFCFIKSSYDAVLDD